MLLALLVASLFFIRRTERAALASTQAPNNSAFFDFLDDLVRQRFYSTDSEIEHIPIAGLDLWIPKSYLMGSYTISAEHEDILLQVLLPNFEPRTPNNIEQFTGGLGWQNRSHIQISNISKRTDTKFVLNKVFELHPSMKEVEPEFGMRHYRSPDPTDGLLHYEIFIDGDPTNFASFIKCQPLEPDPGCEHIFEFQGLYVEINYSKRYLGEWKRTQKSFLALLEFFKTNAQQGELNGSTNTNTIK